MPLHLTDSNKVQRRTSLKAKLAVIAMAAGGLVALTGAHAQGADGAKGGGKRAAEIQQRFKAADTNNDGKLTKEEAKAGMPMVYKHFDEIDTAKAGSITLGDLAAYAKTQRAKKAE